MIRVKLTAKRQATLPKSLCDEMQVGPGDTLNVEKVTVHGETFWCLSPVRADVPPWFGALRKYGQGMDHSIEAMRNSIETARLNERE